MADVADLSEVRALIDQRQYEPALEQLGRLMLGSPDHADAQLLLSDCLLQVGRWEEALPAIDRLITLTPASTLPHRMRCIALANLGRQEDVIAAARAALAVDDKEANAYFLLGAALMELRRNAEARAALEKAVDLEPDVPLYRLALADLLFDAAPPLAEALLERIVADEPTHAAALNDLGVLKQNKGDRAQAEQLYRRALAADAELKVVRPNLETLDSISVRVAGWAIFSGLAFAALGGGPYFLGRWLDDSGHSTIAGAVWAAGGIACVFIAFIMLSVLRDERRAKPLRAPDLRRSGSGSSPGDAGAGKLG